jgi:uncharacterized membrane protein YjgN (DUF898 family)
MDQPSPSPQPTPALLYDGRLGELYAIFLVNILLTILTLGIFRFWAITRYRRYLWSHMRFQGERLEYTGTGGQLFVGYLLGGLLLFGAIALATLLSWLLGQVMPALAVIPIILLYLFIAVLAAGAIFSAQRYRLSRTVWCGIRGGMQGSMFRYGIRAILYWLATLVTFFQLMPWMQVRLAERRINASSFGSARFTCDGRARQLYLPFLATFLVSIVMLVVIGTPVGLFVRSLMPAMAAAGRSARTDPGVLTTVMQQIQWSVIAGGLLFFAITSLVRCWYSACLERHIVGHSALASVRLGSTLTGGALFRLVLGNGCILLFTLGLGYPIVMQRTAQLLARTLWAQGWLDPAALTQSTLPQSRFGEGLYQQLDAGGALF